MSCDDDRAGSARDQDGGCSPEEMITRWRQLGGWPMTLCIRAFNRYDFTSFPGGVANHPVADTRHLAATLDHLARGVPDDAPYPLLVRIQIIRPGQGAPFLSHDCVAQSPDELRAALTSASRRAAERFI